MAFRCLHLRLIFGCRRQQLDGGRQAGQQYQPERWGLSLSFDASTDAAYFYASSGANAYWRIAGGNVTALDTLGVSSEEAWSAVMLGDDLYVRNGGRVVRVPGGSTRGEVVLDGGWNGSLQKMVAAAGKLFLVDAPNPFSGPDSVAWRYDPVQKRLDRIGTYTEISAVGVMGESVYFTDEPQSGPARLMRLSAQATAAGQVATVGPAGESSDVLNIVADGSLLYLHVIIDNGRELWGSDATAAGTRSIARIWDYDQPSKFNNCPCLAVAGGSLYFDRMTSAKSVEMWRVETAGVVPSNDFLYLPNVAR